MRNRIIIAASISLTLASQYATAGQVTNPTYSGGETLDAAAMNNIKAAVNNNDAVNGGQTTAIGVNAAAITTKQDQLTGGSCLAGQVVSSISAAGVVTCEQATALGQTPLTWTTSSTLSTTPVEFTKLTITAPGPGKIFIQIAGSAYLNVDSTTTSSVVAFGNIYLCTATASNTLADCGSDNLYIYTADADNVSATNTIESFALNKVITVPSAGTYQLFLNASTSNALYSLTMYTSQTKATAIYTPQTLTMTSP